MKEIKFETWEAFDKFINTNHYRKWIYRGQSDSLWSMESSLHRTFESAQRIHLECKGKRKDLDMIAHEKVMLDKFKCNAHLYLSHLPKQEDDLSWLSLMQHHGAPTRLLDFSFSIYVALYFALETGENDASIFCINHNAMKKSDQEYFGNDLIGVYERLLYGEEHGDDGCVFTFEPTFSNQRLLSQQGLFVGINTLKFTHEEIINNYDITLKNAYKIIIPKNLRYSGLRKLSQMNINSTNIYPGLDGFCKSLIKQPMYGLKWQKRVGTHRTI